MRILPPLLDCEMTALLQALRRDLRVQQERAEIDEKNRICYAINARCVTRLLEALNPRDAQGLADN